MKIASKYATERPTRWIAESPMNGARYALVILLSVISLFAYGQPLFASCEDCRTTSLIGSVIAGDLSPSALGSDHNCPPSPFSTSDPGTSTYLRILKHSAKARIFFWAHTCPAIPLHPPAACQTAPSKSAPAPSTSWQFVCRAALDPRAPTFFS
jgi:hypothetical protein